MSFSLSPRYVKFVVDSYFGVAGGLSYIKPLVDGES